MENLKTKFQGQFYLYDGHLFIKDREGSQSGRGRLSPKFPISLWNCYQAVLDGTARTNNAVEGWHRGFEPMLAGHPTIWALIDALRKEFGLSETILAQRFSGIPAPKKRICYRDFDYKIENLVHKYVSFPIQEHSNVRLEFLTGMASNIFY